MKRDCPRVLVCTVGAWNDKTGSNTMSELLKDYPKEKLACLYIRAERSDSDSCNWFFHISEGRVIKSIFNRRIEPGEEYKTGDVVSTSEDSLQEKARYEAFRKRRNWFYVFAREWLWMLGRWKSAGLDAFLERFKPEVLVFSIESYIHFNRINEYIIEKCQPRTVVGYLWDDNFTYKQHAHSVGFKLHRWWLRKGVMRLVRKCTTVFAICPKMKREADAEFGIQSVLLTKPIYKFNEINTSEQSSPITILYTGKLLYGRDETVAEIVDAIKVINREKQKVILQLYTNTQLSPDMARRICVEGCCEMKGFVPQSDVAAIQKNADVLLYAESLSDTHLVARLSFSTKMTDYLASGNCIWAVGNRDLAPIEYLREEDAGVVSADRDSILTELQKMVDSPSLLIEYAKKAQQCGRRNHNKDLVIRTFYSAIDS